MHHSAAFKVLERDISEGSENQVDDTKIIPTDKGISSNNPDTFLSSGNTTSLFHSSQQDRCCLVLDTWPSTNLEYIKSSERRQQNVFHFLQMMLHPQLYPTQK